MKSINLIADKYIYYYYKSKVNLIPFLQFITIPARQA